MFSEHNCDCSLSIELLFLIQLSSNIDCLPETSSHLGDRWKMFISAYHNSTFMDNVHSKRWKHCFIYMWRIIKWRLGNVRSVNSVAKCSTQLLSSFLTDLLLKLACVLLTACSILILLHVQRSWFSKFSVTKHAQQQYHVHKPYIQAILWGRRSWGCHPRCLRCQVPSF